MKHIKRLICLLSVLALLVCLIPATLAQELTVGDGEGSPVPPLSYAELFPSQVNPEVVEVTELEQGIAIESTQQEETISPNSIDKPTKFWDLSGGVSYKANLQVVGIKWLYTNYYFKPSSNAKIRVKYTVYSDTHRATKMQIGLYDHDLKKFVSYWTTAGAGGESGTSNTIDFYNLNKSHFYSVAFISVFDGFTHDTLHGTAYISHP